MPYILPVSKTVFRQHPPPHYLDGRLFCRIGHGVSFDTTSDFPDDYLGEIVYEIDDMMVIKFKGVAAILIRFLLIDTSPTVYMVRYVIEQENLVGRRPEIPLHNLQTIANTLRSIHFADLSQE